MYYMILIKVFSNPKYREDFLDGKLYMNPINYFRSFEDEFDSNIADENEAIFAWIHPEEIQLTFKVNGEDSFTIKGSDIAAPLQIRSYAHENMNVFCMTLLHSDGIDFYGKLTEEDSNRLTELLTLPSESERLGDYAIVITNADRFISQAYRAFMELRENGFNASFNAAPVTYYDVNKTLSLKNIDEAVFHKQSKFAHQKEYRICIDRLSKTAEPFILDIGSVRDYVHTCSTNEVNDLIRSIPKIR